MRGHGRNLVALQLAADAANREESVDLFTNMDMGDAEESKDLLDRTYEYCIAQFAAYEGVKGGEFYTLASIVKTIVAILKPFANCRVYEIPT